MNNYAHAICTFCHLDAVAESRKRQMCSMLLLLYKNLFLIFLYIYYNLLDNIFMNIILFFIDCHFEKRGSVVFNWQHCCCFKLCCGVARLS